MEKSETRVWSLLKKNVKFEESKCNNMLPLKFISGNYSIQGSCEKSYVCQHSPQIPIIFLQVFRHVIRHLFAAFLSSYVPAAEETDTIILHQDNCWFEQQCKLGPINT